MLRRMLQAGLVLFWFGSSPTWAQTLVVPPYLGQPLPGSEAVPFAPGTLNTGLATRDITLMPDGSEIYVGIFLPGFRKAVILETHQAAGRWSAPEVAAFSRDPRWRCLEPCISPDGRRFFFVSDRPADPRADMPGPFGIWVMERGSGGWSELCIANAASVLLFVRVRATTGRASG